MSYYHVDTYCDVYTCLSGVNSPVKIMWDSYQTVICLQCIKVEFVTQGHEIDNVIKSPNVNIRLIRFLVKMCRDIGLPLSLISGYIHGLCKTSLANT
jgi:hypothetical protein